MLAKHYSSVFDKQDLLFNLQHAFFTFSVIYFAEQIKNESSSKLNSQLGLVKKSRKLHQCLSEVIVSVMIRMAIRTLLKINYKIGSNVTKTKEENSIIQFIKLSAMFPFYYPFDFTNFMPSFGQPYSDPSVLFQYFGQNQQIIRNETIVKQEENHTNYSININRAQEKQLIKVQSLPIQKQDFSSAKARKPTKYKKIKKVITDSNSFKIKIKESKQSDLKFRYTHKNFESNIINKIFSFLWSEDKSKSFVNQILKDKTKVTLYYDFIKIVRKYCKRYINKEYLRALCDYNERHIAYKIVTKQTEKLKYFTMSEFSQTIRKLILTYLNSVCTISITTSKKMRSDIWKEHFEKMRNIKHFMFFGLSSEEYDQRMNFSYFEIYNKSQPDQNENEGENEIENEI